MEKVKISLAGECVTERQSEALLQAYNILIRKVDEVDVVGDLGLIKQVMEYDLDNSYDLFSDVMLDNIENSDVCVVIAPELKEGGYCSLGWILGYCWTQGVSVVLLELTEDAEKIHPLAARSVQAHLSSLEELRTYAFKDMPYVADPKSK